MYASSTFAKMKLQEKKSHLNRICTHDISNNTQAWKYSRYKVSTKRTSNNCQGTKNKTKVIMEGRVHYC